MAHWFLVLPPRRVFTFLHAADIHLDSPLRGLDRYEGAPAQEIRGATRRALENLVDLALSERVAFVVMAGDLYDGDWKDFDTGLFFVRQMQKLREADIPVLGVHGNHDAASKITRSLVLPSNVYFFPTKRASTRRLEGLGVAVHGQSFASRCTTADLAKGYPAPAPGCFNLGLLHTSMTGREGHDSYAPCSESCLRESGYEYWALGHVHQREVLPGTPTIAYPGNVQGRHIRESGPKGCLLVEVADDHTLTTRFEPLDVLRWNTVEVALNDVESKHDVIGRVNRSLHETVLNAEDRLAAVRVVLQGQTPLADTIAADLRQWTADIRAVGLDVGANRLWIERVKNETRRPLEISPPEGDDGPLLEVSAMVTELAQVSGISDALGLDLTLLVNKLPPEARAAFDTTDIAWWREVLGEAEAKLLANLKE